MASPEQESPALPLANPDHEQNPELEVDVRRAQRYRPQFSALFPYYANFLLL